MMYREKMQRRIIKNVFPLHILNYEDDLPNSKIEYIVNNVRFEEKPYLRI